MIGIIFLVLALSGPVFSKKLLGDYFSPPAIYHFFWCTSLGLLQLDWIAFDPLRPHVWQIIGFSYLAFMGGCLVLCLYAWSRPRSLLQPPKLQHVSRMKLERTLLWLFLLGVFGFLAQLAHLQSTVGITTFLSDPQLARETHSNVKYLGFFNLLNVANFALATIYLMIFKRPAKWVIAILIWAVASSLLTTDRTRFFYMIIWSFYIGVYAFHRVHLTPKAIGGGLLTLAALLGFFMLVAKIYVKQAYDDNMEYINLPPEYASLADPYIYITGSYPVLQAFLEDKRSLDWGKNTFEPIVKVIEVIYPEMERAELVGKFYRVPIELNVCTYLEPFFRDFGTAGILLGPFLLGLICMAVYLGMRQRKTLFSLYLAALLGFCITISIFVNHFSQTATWFFILVGYGVWRACFTAEPEDMGQYREGVFPPQHCIPEKRPG